MIGTAPSVEYTLPMVRFDDYDAIITTNGGIRLHPNPTYYVLIDMVASEGYYEEGVAAQSMGTKLVTLKREQRALKSRKVDHFDMFISISEGQPTRDQFGRFRYSGPFCLEFACHHGAKQIDLIGFDGYRKFGDYHEATKIPVRRRPVKYGIYATRDYVQPACEDIAEAWYDVTFNQIGDPVFGVDRPNWNQIELGAVK